MHQSYYTVLFALKVVTHYLPIIVLATLHGKNDAVNLLPLIKDLHFYLATSIIFQHR